MKTSEILEKAFQEFRPHINGHNRSINSFFMALENVKLLEANNNISAYGLEVSKILDKHLPANGIGTERERLRIEIHKDFIDLINKLNNHLS